MNSGPINYNPISANTLFHFTKSIDNLISILEVGFKPRYCLEDLSFIGLGEVAVPMTCFCDIPLSHIRKHSSTYGDYAIGLSKDWGIRNGISPIMYTYENSASTRMLRENLMMFHRGRPEDVHRFINDAASNSDRNNPTALLVESISRQSAFLSYTKLYEGRFWRNGDYLDHPVRFYDEREWRYVPRFESTILMNVRNQLDKDSYLNPAIINEENCKLQDCAINFNPDDIRYIVVNKEAEILPMFDHVSRIKEKFSSDQKKVVKTRIISMEQILEDF